MSCREISHPNARTSRSKPSRGSSTATAATSSACAITGCAFTVKTESGCDLPQNVSHPADTLISYYLRRYLEQYLDKNMTQIKTLIRRTT